jgi:hypothetical protein
MTQCKEEIPENDVPVDTSKKNPNNKEYDNLYLDLSKKT